MDYEHIVNTGLVNTAMTDAPIARDHHYVPRFLLRPWKVGGQLRGYYWDERQQKVRIKERGVSAFCSEIDLLSINANGLRPDALEQGFFKDVDDRGAKVRGVILANGPGALSNDQRVEFARLLLSLEARRPAVVSRVRSELPAYLKEALAGDPEVRAAFEAHGIKEQPLEWYERITGVKSQDRAVLQIQPMVDNPEIGTRLINAHWRLFKIAPDAGTFLLCDRPFIRLNGHKDARAVWALPLTPHALFVAANSQSVIDAFERQSEKVLRKSTNQSTLNQTERYVFAVDSENDPLIHKRLSSRRTFARFHPDET